MDKGLNLRSLKSTLTQKLRQISRYSLIFFLVLIAAAYGFLVMQIETLRNAEPSETQISAQHDPIKTSRIDDKVVKQLESLRDNSVNVQTLFEQARNNPFQE